MASVTGTYSCPCYCTVGYANVCLYFVPTGTEDLWPLLLGLTGAPAIVQLVMLPFCYESPRYLLIQKGKQEKAIKGNVAGDRYVTCSHKTGLPKNFSPNRDRRRKKSQKYNKVAQN